MLREQKGRHNPYYNSTFLHHELCTELFEGNTQISHRKLFGSHMHAIVVHAPIQDHVLVIMQYGM